MSTRTIIEINHDYISNIKLIDIADLLFSLRGSDITGELNKAQGDPVNWIPGIRILGQRHHSETLKLEVK